MLFFGFSTTFWPLVVLRGLQGSFNGNIGVSLVLQHHDVFDHLSMLTQGVSKVVIAEVRPFQRFMHARFSLNASGN